ncbi:hypothetical protein KLP28_08675 [Nocardioidaceae bacterium]|nr:hypothetical protein KLP28_08675 [Nocardioidaceae bacterium]
MSGQAVSLEEARQRRSSPTGSRRGLGDHGKRTSEATRDAAVLFLLERGTITGKVTLDDKKVAARRADVTVRTINTWWRAACELQVEELQPVTGTEPLPSWLYRYQDANDLQLTPAEVSFFGRFSRTIDAIRAIHADPTHRLHHYSRSALYGAWDNVSKAVREGARKGSAAQRAIEATWPLTGRERVNETWSIDEYDLKLSARNENGELIEPKLLLIRDRASGLPLAYSVLPYGARGEDTGVLLAAAAIGYSCPDPRDPSRTVEVSGVARLLVSDQHGNLIGTDAKAAARRLGIGNDPIASHTPQSNGDHEQMHLSLVGHFADGAGSRRGWKNIADERLDHGELPFEAVVAEVDDWFATYIATPYQSGPYAGRSRLEVYADLRAQEQVYEGPTLTEEDEGAVARYAGERTYDATRGLHFEGRYWLSNTLADTAKPGERITLRQLLDPDTLYAYDRKGRFIGTVSPRDEAPVGEVEKGHQHRAQRDRFTQRAVAEQRASQARDDALDAWDEVGDALADASESDATEAVGPEVAGRDHQDLPPTYEGVTATSPSQRPSAAPAGGTTRNRRSPRRGRQDPQVRPPDALSDDQLEDLADSYGQNADSEEGSDDE